MAGIFICYRRRDSESYAPTLAQELQRGLTSWKIFLDLRNLNYGSHFPSQIHQALAESSVMLVVIGKGWLDEVDEAGARRLDDPDDWVRAEIREAMRLRLRIIPILIQGASPPDKDALPADIQTLAELQAFRVSNFTADVAQLSDIIELRISIAEPAVIMATAASVAFAIRAAQREPMQVVGLAVGQFDEESIALLRAIFSTTSSALYYAILALGVMVAIRTRTRLRLEQSLRVAVSVGTAVAISQCVLLPWARSGYYWYSTLQTVLTFAGIAVGFALGMKSAELISAQDRKRWLACCIAFVASALIGGALQSGFSGLQQLSGLVANPRTLLWGCLVIGTSFAWWIMTAPEKRPTLSQIVGILLPVLGAMLLVDVLSGLTRLNLAAQNLTPDGYRVMQAKLGLDNALFFAATAAAGAWRVNAWQRARFDGHRRQQSSAA